MDWLKSSQDSVILHALRAKITHITLPIALKHNPVARLALQEQAIKDYGGGDDDEQFDQRETATL